MVDGGDAADGDRDDFAHGIAVIGGIYAELDDCDVLCVDFADAADVRTMSGYRLGGGDDRGVYVEVGIPVRQLDQ